MSEIFTVSENGITIRNGEVCWRCGKKAPEVKMTIHHGIPQVMKPLRNVEIPICEGCHDEINTQDVNQTLQFVYKLQKNTEDAAKALQDMLSQTRKASSMIENQVLIKFKTRGKDGKIQSNEHKDG